MDCVEGQGDPRGAGAEQGKRQIRNAKVRSEHEEQEAVDAGMLQLRGRGKRKARRAERPGGSGGRSGGARGLMDAPGFSAGLMRLAKRPAGRKGPAVGTGGGRRRGLDAGKGAGARARKGRGR
jgi:hypothetical protein